MARHHARPRPRDTPRCKAADTTFDPRPYKLSEQDSVFVGDELQRTGGMSWLLQRMNAGPSRS